RSWRTDVVLPAAALALSACAPNAPAPPREPAVSGPEAAGPAAVRPSLAVGALHACVLRAQGDVLCWGYNASGQLGRRSGSRRPAPAPAPVEGLRDVRQVALGMTHSCALTDGGDVFCWGNNHYGQLDHTNNLGTEAPNAKPTRVEGLHGVRQIGLGAHTSCALTQEEHVYCWGDGRHGQLGDPATSGLDRPNPRPLLVVGR
ncbi:MAG TPA: hypothetical protein VFS00_02440, partial [Polyangiaceae bacterium]|nr:hypothetical protein [Polyangiaceae bacterium]